MYTEDIPASFFVDIIAVARRLGMFGHEIDLLRPLMNESSLSFKAHNAVGDASGIFQAMPQTLRNLGFVGDWHDFVRLDADQQLPWLEKYYRPYTGGLSNATAVYMATFCPAWIRHSVSPTFVICSKEGLSDGGLSVHMSELWYEQNKGLDKNHDGVIDVSDLTLAIVEADQGSRWQEIVDRLHEAMILVDTPTPEGHIWTDLPGIEYEPPEPS